MLFSQPIGVIERLLLSCTTSPSLSPLSLSLLCFRLSLLLFRAQTRCSLTFSARGLPFSLAATCPESHAPFSPSSSLSLPFSSFYSSSCLFRIVLLSKCSFNFSAFSLPLFLCSFSPSLSLLFSHSLLFSLILSLSLSLSLDLYFSC